MEGMVKKMYFGTRYVIIPHELLRTKALTLYLLMLSADNLCKQFGLRSGPTKCWAWSGSKMFDTHTLMVLLKDFFRNS